LKQEGFSQAEVDTLMIENPRDAFTIQIRSAASS